MDSRTAGLVVAGGLAAGGIALCMSPTSSSAPAALTLASLKDPSLEKLLVDQGLDPVRSSPGSCHNEACQLTVRGCA